MGDKDPNRFQERLEKLREDDSDSDVSENRYIVGTHAYWCWQSRNIEREQARLRTLAERVRISVEVSAREGMAQLGQLLPATTGTGSTGTGTTGSGTTGTGSTGSGTPSTGTTGTGTPSTGTSTVIGASQAGPPQIEHSEHSEYEDEDDFGVDQLSPPKKKTKTKTKTTRDRH